MKILITNDDGIEAAGLLPLARWAQKLGDVTVIAPKTEQSAKSHAIEIRKGFEVKKVDFGPGITAYSLDSTPADCVRYAVLGLKEKYDLVISGINRGLNIGADIMYSGTVAAVFEAGNLGVKAVAVSTPPSYYLNAVEHLDTIVDYFREHKLLDIWGIYNVNIPNDPGCIRITHQGGPYYSDVFTTENDIVTPHGVDVFAPSQDDSVDTDCVLRCGNISVMPLALQRTELPVFHKLAGLNK